MLYLNLRNAFNGALPFTGRSELEMRFGKKETIIVIIGLILVGGFVVSRLIGVGIGIFQVEHGVSEGTIPDSEDSPLFPQSQPPRERLNEILGYPLLAVLIGIFVALFFFRARAKGQRFF